MDNNSTPKHNIVNLKQLLVAEKQELVAIDNAVQLLKTRLDRVEDQLITSSLSPHSTSTGSESFENGHCYWPPTLDGSKHHARLALHSGFVTTTKTSGPSAASVLLDQLGEDFTTVTQGTEHYNLYDVDLYHHLELLKVRRDVLQVSIQQRRTELNPYAHLPFDILSVIQHLVVVESYVDYRVICECTVIPLSRSSPFQVALNLASVSAFWWNVAVSSPRLWRYITFDLDNAHLRTRDYWRAALNRSWPYTIEVFLIYCPISSLDSPMELEELGAPDMDLPPAILDLKNHASRIQHLHFLYDDRITADQVIYELSGVGVLSLYAFDNYRGLTPFHMPPAFNSITHLAAYCTVPIFPAPLPSLVHLSIDNLAATLSGNHLLAPLAQTPNLQELDIGQQSATANTNPRDRPTSHVTLQALSVLRVHVREVYTFVGLICNNHLSLPSLRDLTISGLRPKWPSNSWVHLWRNVHFGPRVKILRLRGDPDDVHILVEIKLDLIKYLAPYLHNLEVLDIDDGIARRALELLWFVKSSRSYPWFKSLRAVTVDGVDLATHHIFGGRTA